MYEVTLRLTDAGAQRLRAIRPSSESAQIEPGDVVINFERERIALGTVLELGGECEVLAPATLRDKLRALGASLHAVYERS